MSAIQVSTGHENETLNVLGVVDSTHAAELELGACRGLQIENDHSIRDDKLSLPIMVASYETSETLSSCMLKNPHAIWLIKVTGNYWPESTPARSNNWDIYYKVYYICLRTFLIGMFAYSFAGFFIIISGPRKYPPAQTITVTLSIILGVLAAIPTQYLNQIRLTQNARIQDSSVIDECARIASTYGVLYLVTVLVVLLGYIILREKFQFYFMFVVGQLALSGYLTFNMMILLMDLKVSSLMIDQLLILTDAGKLSFHKFCAVRTDIHRRVSASQWATDFIVAPCIGSAMSMLVLLYYTANGLVTVIIFSILIKEIIFVAVAFYYVARVNGKADALLAQLCADMWGLAANNVGVSEADRVAICISSMSKPISFTLLFQRLSMQRVCVSFLGFAITFIVGLMKTAVGI